MALGWFLLGLVLGTSTGIFVAALLQAAAKNTPSPRLAFMEPELGMASPTVNTRVPERSSAEPEMDLLCQEAGALCGPGV